MQLIAPFEFIERFPAGRSLAVVGNAPSVLTGQFGPTIDDHDVVVRFNECALDSYETNIGRRTDILVSNPYAENRRPLLDGRSAAVLLILAPQTRRGDAAAFARWAGDHPVLFSYTPALVGVAGSDHTAALTTGTYAIHLLARLLQPSRIFLTGFTLFADKQRTHYWPGAPAPGLKAHDMRREALIFCSILNSLTAPVTATADVLSVFQRTGVRPQRAIRLGGDPPGSASWWARWFPRRAS